MIDGCKSFLSLEERLEVILFSVFVPLLKAIIVLPQEMSSDFMVHHTLNGLLSIVNRQSNHDFTVRFLVVMHDTCWSNSILRKLIR